ncbi:hypothetical protein ACFQI7_13230 [Paenibacillus allorhizosphaerae]|uniref:hypothetical protein n=1 Tax=Paenibacillus allorhizosphaerae TaxID=2849866 RepID=UPI001C406B80|nr:hypothetical protein [Paenibacillus allorhizosphaerae]
MPNQTTKDPVVLPKSQMIQDWNVSLISISSKNNLPTYEIELTYKGDTKAENTVVETGNAIFKLPLIEKNHYTRIGSMYSSNEKQIQVAVTWNEGDQGFKQTVLFDV